MAAATLYVVPASHPCAAVEAALRLKGIAYDRVDRLPVLHKPLQLLRFRGTTVPGLVLDGRRLLGSRRILRALEERVPEPPLLPSVPEQRARVERAEEWGEEVLQPLVRRLLWAALRRRPAAMASYAEGARLPLPAPVARLGAPLVAWAECRIHAAADLTVRADLAHLPGHLRRVDRWIEDGVLGGERPNAADLQIGAGLRLALTVGDVAAIVDAHAAGALARRWFPDYPGACPAGALPAGWLPRLTS
jgi:glutathione S-transferase